MINICLKNIGINEMTNLEFQDLRLNFLSGSAPDGILQKKKWDTLKHQPYHKRIEKSWYSLRYKCERAKDQRSMYPFRSVDSHTDEWSI